MKNQVNTILPSIEPTPKYQPADLPYWIPDSTVHLKIGQIGIVDLK